jgi:hypothetical protein
MLMLNCFAKLIKGQIENIKLTKMTIKQTLTALALAGLGFVTVGCNRTIHTDLNNDGLNDVILPHKRSRGDYVLIQKTNNIYDKCNVVICDGIPFYKSRDGVTLYDSWGSIFVSNKLVKIGSL